MTVRTALTLEEGLERYYQASPDFTRNQDLYVGWFRVPWIDLWRHDIMHVITGYGVNLQDELQLIGFLLTSLTWRRPWYYYPESFVVFLVLLFNSLRGQAWESAYIPPHLVCWYYIKGIRQGFTVRKKIDAYIDPNSVMHCTLDSLREEYGIRNTSYYWDN
ncbi:hypothetical protein ACQ4M3_07945 [Leptolyngbya sp. AN03gr2]|uniref:hypothetical protein n=1 Tax=unclassified Leptolyngbya TaxID=2650499 RepID=UPI003D314521